ncbi:MAG TPA: glycosyltransferase family 39 protein [Gaiellaceae bacterium]|nr:glycosyltransferase family 39 protein [Gaiellaceae bacterium]
MSTTSTHIARRLTRPRSKRSLPPAPIRRALLPTAVVGAAAGLVWLALPTVWWTPLNVDEELTLRLGDFSFRHIFHIVSTQRGGGPIHFWLEHFLLDWWPGIAALRVPSLLFSCLALPAVALIVRRLAADELPAAAVVVLTALSPIPVMYATFGRPHTLLFAWLMWATVVALAAADSGDRRLWIAAGALLGLTVFVHPTAPLYALTAFGASWLYAPGSLREKVRAAWPGAVALLVAFVPYYVKTLHVLSDRYGVGGSGQAGRTFSGRPVWEDALHFVAPGRHDLNYFTVLAALGVVVLLARRSYRPLMFCVATVAAPVVFFSVVPTSGDSALFFDRYMIPVTPAFLVLVCVGVFTVASWAGAWRVLVAVVLVGGLAAIEVRFDLDHRRATHRIGISDVVAAVKHEPAGTVLFGSTGTSGASFSAFDYGHPANLLDHLVALRVPSLARVDDEACANLGPFLQTARPRYGLWLFYAASPEEAAAAQKALETSPIGGHYFAVRSPEPLAPRALVREGERLRLAWKQAVPLNIRVDELLIADRSALAGTCVPYGDLGDPGISPHWPPVKTTHQ